ncbi:ABC transporter substrate-binding protein [Methylocella silvestris]|uniref:Nitrate ABC transporter substrate-binding protein n=1 Tax=Methylocella silvestris TaxID=199596 RepID=A0A2J7TGR2_METSI|nr:ABC transporter substrate-binding protein [Methylocella silvestris]PNG25939.1 nitrate ABC transporter substrate-binding protein [Methylocella silvestris]
MTATLASPGRQATLSAVVAGLLIVAFFGGPALALDRVTFATNWLAEGEHGGFYQAKADGTYQRYGLDVTILQGGPQANNRLLLAAGKIEFNLAANLIQSFDAASQNIPLVAVAALFQKDPFILMSHPDAGFDKMEDLPRATAFIGKDAFVSVYQWLKSAYGFSEDKVQPYNFNAAPFIRDKNSIQQGYATSEPFSIEREGGFRPNVFLVADYGYDSYSTLIETRADLIAQNADLVQRFVDASIIGWINYLYGDSSKADALILADNPDMTKELLAYSREKMRELGIVVSGDARTLGVGAMTEPRVKSFFGKMAAAGLFKPDLDYRRAYTLQFINKGVGLDLIPRP